MITKLLHICLTNTGLATFRSRQHLDCPPESVSAPVELDRKARMHYLLQRFLGRLAIFGIAPLTYLVIKLAGYRVRDLDRFRKVVRKKLEQHDGPWMICANHLTMIDSALIAYAMAPLWRYLSNYRLLPWNVPEQANFQRSLLSNMTC